MKLHKAKLRWELVKHALSSPVTLTDEVHAWLKDNKVFGWHVDIHPIGTKDWYIYFTNSTDAMLFTLRWS